MSRTIRLVGDRQRDYARQSIGEAPDGYVVRIAEETRSLAQNRMMHALIKDIRSQVPDMACYSADDCKLRFLHALGQELRFLPTLEGGGMFPVGQRSSTLTKAQFAGLIEIMFAYGARECVKWSPRAMDAYSKATG